MALTLYRPFRPIRPVRHFLSPFFGHGLRDLFGEETPLMTKGFHPVVDISETNGNINVKAELPGMKEEDVKVEVKDGVLTLKGEKKREEKVEKEGYYREESHYGSFERSFRLPEHVETEKITAELKEGVLDITIPKPEEVKPKEIEITSQ